MAKLPQVNIIGTDIKAIVHAHNNQISFWRNGKIMFDVSFDELKTINGQIAREVHRDKTPPPPKNPEGGTPVAAAITA